MTTTAVRAAGLLLAGSLFAGAGALMVPSRSAVVPVVLPSGRVIHAELARTSAERARGLMFRNAMPTDAGMLIVFPESGRHAIWMKNCRFPLDLVWLDMQGRVVSVFESAPPCHATSCPIYTPGVPAQYALELTAGSARQHRLRPGVVVRLSPGGWSSLWRETL